MPDPVTGFLSTAVNAVQDATSSKKGSDWNYKDWRAKVEEEYHNKGMTDYDKAFIYNSAIAAYQNDLALQNWNRENAYNSPEAQMQRYLAAGLNPNLVYGAGASSGNAGNIGTPTVGGQISPTEIQDSRTRRAAQKVNAWQAGLAMLNSSLDVFQKLMTVRSTIKSTNAENAANYSQGVWNRDYWNALGPKAFDAAGAKIFGWNAEASEALLRDRIADYKLNFHPKGELWSNELGESGIPYYVQDLNARLENSQADLTWQNLMNQFKHLDYTLATDKDFGLRRFKKTEYDLLKSRLALQRSANKLNMDRHNLFGLDYKIKSKVYDWYDANQLTRSLFPMLQMLSEVW